MKPIDQLINVGNEMQTQHLAWGTSGNISSRISEEEIIISSSGTKVGHLNKDSFVHCSIASGGVTQGNGKASKETFMHTGIYKNRKDVNAVLHSSPYYSTLVACSHLEIKPNLFIESMYYLENVAYVDYFHPGSKQLADAVAEKSKEASVIIMKNHGVVVCDSSLDEAFMRLETLEMVAKMILDQKKAGIDLIEVEDQQVYDFLYNSHYKPRK